MCRSKKNYDDDYLEIYKFNQEGEELARWECTPETSILRDFRWNRDSTSLFVLPGSKISPNGTWSLYGFKFNTNTMALDTFAGQDNNVYDYYCPEGVTELNFNFPELDVALIEQTASKAQLKIAPNPARNLDYLYFDITDYTGSAKLEIHNMQGSLIKSYALQAAVGRVQEDISRYPKGLYVVSLIVTDRLVESSKLVVE